MVVQMRAAMVRGFALALCGAGVFLGASVAALTPARTAECPSRNIATGAANPAERSACAKSSSELKSGAKARKAANKTKRIAKKSRSKFEARRARIKAKMEAKNLRGYKMRRAENSRRQLRVFESGRPDANNGYRIGPPYVIGGRTYTPHSGQNYRAEGKASWYGGSFHGQITANGEKFDMNALSAAHPTLPLPSYVRVTNLANNTSVVVRVNDRGPFHGNRLIDLSVRAAKLLGFYDQGLAQVRVEYIGQAELAGSDNEKLVATLRNDNPVQIAVNTPSGRSAYSQAQSARR